MRASLLLSFIAASCVSTPVADAAESAPDRGVERGLFVGAELDMSVPAGRTGESRADVAVAAFGGLAPGAELLVGYAFNRHLAVIASGAIALPLGNVCGPTAGCLATWTKGAAHARWSFDPGYSYARPFVAVGLGYEHLGRGPSLLRPVQLAWHGPALDASAGLQFRLPHVTFTPFVGGTAGVFQFFSAQGGGEYLDARLAHQALHLWGTVGFRFEWESFERGERTQIGSPTPHRAAELYEESFAELRGSKELVDAGHYAVVRARANRVLELVAEAKWLLEMVPPERYFQTTSHGVVNRNHLLELLQQLEVSARELLEATAPH